MLLLLAIDVNKCTSGTFVEMLFCLHSLRSAFFEIIAQIFVLTNRVSGTYAYLFI